MNNLEQLEKAILDLHGCRSRHEGSVAVNETFRGAPVWEGVVEIFLLEDHPTAEFAYAWSYTDDPGNCAMWRSVAFRPLIPLTMPFGLT